MIHDYRDVAIFLGAVCIWVTVGYFASRLCNAVGDDLRHWKWRNPVTTDKSLAFFGIGVVGGPISLVIFAVVFAVAIAEGVTYGLLQAIGRLLAPRQ